MSVNKVILIGRVGAAPVMQSTSANICVCSVSVVTNHFWHDKNGQKQETAEWHKLVFYHKLAAVVQEFALTGRLIYAEGRIQSSKYVDSKGIDRIGHDIVCDVFKALD